MDVVLEMVLPEDSDEKATRTTRRQKRLSKRERRRKEESSNSTVCPRFNFDKLNSRLNKEAGSPTVFAWLIRVDCVMFGVISMTVGLVTGSFNASSAQNALFAVALVGLSVCALLSIFIVDYLRRVLRPTEHLDTLGAGNVKISARAARSRRLSLRTRPSRS